jgi:hypothetical protein
MHKLRHEGILRRERLTYSFIYCYFKLPADGNDTVRRPLGGYGQGVAWGTHGASHDGSQFHGVQLSSRMGMENNEENLLANSSLIGICQLGQY